MTAHCHFLQLSWSCLKGCAFPGPCTLTCGSEDKSLRGQSVRLAADEDYTIKLFVNSVAHNRPKYHKRCLHGCMRRIPCYCLENDNKHIYRQFKLSYIKHASQHMIYFWFIRKKLSCFKIKSCHIQG